MVIKENVDDFNLDQIFDCGQCFRWTREEDGSYTGIAFGRPVNMKFEPYEKDGFCGRLTIDNIEESEFELLWREYLDLDRDYSAIKSLLAEKDSTMRDAIKSGPGIRILRQESWETIISFIVSQNNNIPRIKKCIEGLCEGFGKSAGQYRGKNWFAFPDVSDLAKICEEDLAPIRLGYRAKYIIETAKKVASDEADFDALRLEETSKGYEYLTGLCGVGPKVANCILLFGLGKHETFPIDVWVKRVMNKLYGIDENQMKAMSAYAAENFGQYGGIAQQYLFYHIRQI